MSKPSVRRPRSEANARGDVCGAQPLLMQGNDLGIAVQLLRLPPCLGELDTARARKMPLFIQHGFRFCSLRLRPGWSLDGTSDFGPAARQEDLDTVC
jgi:hypothetical protein